MTVSIRVPTWRSLALLLAGAALGAAVMAPATSGVTTYTRSASCAGLSFYPADGAPYSHFGTMRTQAEGPTGDGYFICDPGLPNGAVVTKVEFTLKDVSPYDELSECGLVRSGLTPSTAEVAQVLAVVPATGVTAQPGIVRLFDDSIAYATIDNARFGYYLQCRFSDVVTPILGIYGADVIYKITAAKG